MGYDVIGDIHGHAEKLTALLRRLGYIESRGGWRHPERRAIFVGDFIDRGTQGVETVDIVRAMVDNDAAFAVMGNHELNAIAWHTPDDQSPGDFLRPHFHRCWGAKNRAQHASFLAQVEGNPARHKEIIDWFKTLPLWLDLPDIRVVHACWHDRAIKFLATKLRGGRYLTDELLVEATTEVPSASRTDPESLSTFTAVETLLKGIEVALPEPHYFHDKDGMRRHHVRIRWWDPSAVTYGQGSLGANFTEDVARTRLPAGAVASTALQKPTFFGHYWMTGTPVVQHERAACVDYSAGKGGSLVAYRWDGESELSSDHFAVVP